MTELSERTALARVVFEKHFTILKRYFLNTAGGVAVTYIMFALVFFGGRSAAPGTISDSLAGIIVGFFLWTMSFGAFQDPSQSLVEEAQWGTLEQLYMSPLRFTELLTYRIVFNLLVNIVTGLVMLVLMMVTTGKYLSVDLVTVVPLVILSLCSAVGLGVALGGIALVYKRVSNIFLIVQFLFVGALAVPSKPYVFNLLPLALGNDLIRKSMEEGVRLWELPTTDLVVLVAKAAVFLAIGYLIMIRMVGVARERGVFGHY